MVGARVEPDAKVARGTIGLKSIVYNKSIGNSMEINANTMLSAPVPRNDIAILYCEIVMRKSKNTVGVISTTCLVCDGIASTIQCNAVSFYCEARSAGAYILAQSRVFSDGAAVNRS